MGKGTFAKTDTVFGTIRRTSSQRVTRKRCNKRVSRASQTNEDTGPGEKGKHTSPEKKNFKLIHEGSGGKLPLKYDKTNGPKRIGRGL